MIKQRCAWANTDPLYQQYHDEEWGEPVYDNHTLFECLMLEGMQAGLSWITILKKRQNYRDLFHNFNPRKIILMTEQDVDALVQNEGIIRHRGKINAIINNAKMFLKLEQNNINFSDWLWSFVDHTPIKNHYHQLAAIPAQTDISQQMSKGLKKAGFKFVGPTTCYAFMQACGMVNDHLLNCFKY